VTDFAYKEAGVDAIFLGNPLERRFRNMHTLAQQIQVRSARRPRSACRPRCFFET
jgi:hypothetical protein